MLLVDLITVWAGFLLIVVLVNRGVPIFQELIRDMTDFFMEKRLARVQTCLKVAAARVRLHG